MATISDELQNFYQYAEQRLRDGGRSETLDEIYAEWRTRNRTVEELENDALAIRAALRDIKKGETGRPIEEFAAEFRQRNGI